MIRRMKADVSESATMARKERQYVRVEAEPKTAREIAAMLKEKEVREGPGRHEGRRPE